MKTYTNPKWWNQDHESSWQKTKSAFRRDWDQTKHDFGAKEPDTHQNVSHTVKQASGKESIPPRHQSVYEDLEPAYRFGYGAHSQYSVEHPQWNDKLESNLKKEWESLGGRKENWERDLPAIQHGWNYEFDEDEELETTHHK